MRRSKDPTVFAVLFEDTAALIGLVIALIGIALGEMLQMPVLDGVASLGIALVLAGTAIFLGYESQSLLTGEAAYPEVRRGIEQIARAAPGVHRINEVLTMHFGPEQVLAALSLDFDDAISAEQVEEAVADIERQHQIRVPGSDPRLCRGKGFRRARSGAWSAPELRRATASSCRAVAIRSRRAPSSGYSAATTKAQDCVEPIQAAVGVRRAAPPLGDQHPAQHDQAARRLDQIAVCGLLAERAIERGEGRRDVALRDRPVVLGPCPSRPSPRPGKAEMVARALRRLVAGPQNQMAQQKGPGQHRDGARFAKTRGAAVRAPRFRLPDPRGAARSPRRFGAAAVPLPATSTGATPIRVFMPLSRSLPGSIATRISSTALATSSTRCSVSVLGAARRQQRKCRRGARHRRRAERRRQ